MLWWAFRAAPKRTRPYTATQMIRDQTNLVSVFSYSIIVHVWLWSMFLFFSKAQLAFSALPNSGFRASESKKNRGANIAPRRRHEDLNQDLAQANSARERNYVEVIKRIWNNYGIAARSIFTSSARKLTRLLLVPPRLKRVAWVVKVWVVLLANGAPNGASPTAR